MLSSGIGRNNDTESNVRLIVPIWAVVAFFAVMNTTMFNVSLPAVIAGLNVSQGMGSWILSGYSITFALATIVASRLSDMVSLRALVAAGAALLGAASFAGLAADRFAWLVAVRVVQAMGAGMLLGIGVILARRLVPFEKRGRALAIIGTGSSLSYGVGPIVGGIVTDAIGWNGLFAIPCLVLPLACILWRLLPKEQLPPQRFDAVGAVLTAGMVVLLLLALTRLSAVFLVCGLFAAALNIVYLLRVKEPFVSLFVLKVPHFPKLLPVAVTAMAMNLSLLYLIPLSLSGVHGRAAGVIGFFLFPGALMSVTMSRFVGRWIDQYGPHRVMLAGQLVIFLAVITLALFSHASIYVIIFGYMLFAPGFSALMSSINHELSSILPKERLGSGMGLTQLMQYNGGAFGVAMCGVLLDWNWRLPPEQQFALPFGLLSALLAVSSGFLVWYLRSNGNNQAGHQIFH